LQYLRAVAKALPLHSVSGSRLTLTDIGRRFKGITNLRYGIKRADRLLGNIYLQNETSKFYGSPDISMDGL